MATGSKKIRMFIDRLMSRIDFDERLVQFFEAIVNETVAAFLQGKSGTFETSPIDVDNDPPAGPYVDEFLLDLGTPPNSKRVAVGNGQVITLETGLLGETEEIRFENANTVKYEVAIRYNVVEDDVAINPRKGIPEYRTEREVFGEVGFPTGVVDNTTNIELDLTDLTDPNFVGTHSFAGRKVRAWMTTPVSGVQSVAFFDGIIQLVGGVNVLQIPYSGGNGPLGQDTSSGPPSTTITDYKVHVLGPSINKGTGTPVFSDELNYACMCIITGAGTGNAASFDTSCQNAVFLVTLDNAYDGPGGGAGNVINVDVDSKPVHLRGFDGIPEFRPDIRNILQIDDPDGNRVVKVEQYGRIARPPYFADELVYPQSTWLNVGQTPQKYIGTAPGTTVIRAISPTTELVDYYSVFGAALVQAVDPGGAPGTATRVILETASIDCEDRRPRFYSRTLFRGMEASYTGYIGLAQDWSWAVPIVPPLPGPMIGFRLLNSTITGIYVSAAGAVQTTVATLGVSAGSPVELYFVAIDDVTIEFWWTGMAAPESMIIGDSLDDGAVVWNLSMGARAESTNPSPNNHDILVDYWEYYMNDRIRGA